MRSDPAYGGQNSGTGEEILGVSRQNQWQLEQLEALQPPHPPDEPRELTDLPPLENPKREIFLRTLLLLHFSQGGYGELELETMVSKT